MKVAFTEDERKLIDSQKVLRFNSLTSDGQIHSVPICFAFDGTRFFFHRRRKDRKRWHNVIEHNKVSLELDAYTEDWSGNAGILIYGTVKFIDSGPKRDSGLARMRAKYLQYRGEHGLRDSTSMVIFEPSKVISWHH
jgi:general stress protein 26